MLWLSNQLTHTTRDRVWMDSYFHIDRVSLRIIQNNLAGQVEVVAEDQLCTSEVRNTNSVPPSRTANVQ